MLVMVAVPAGITLHTVRAPAIVQMTSTNPTPYGYSWSLLLFVVPIVVIAVGISARVSIVWPGLFLTAVTRRGGLQE